MKTISTRIREDDHDWLMENRGKKGGVADKIHELVEAEKKRQEEKT